MYKTTLSGQVWRFDSLKTLMAKASPARSGDALAGVIAHSAEERMAAKMTLAEVPLTDILDNPLIPYEQDEVTRLILDTHDAQGFAALRHLTVGDFRDWLLDDATDTATLQRVARAITPEMAAAVSKLMRNQDPVSYTHLDVYKRQLIVLLHARASGGAVTRANPVLKEKR